MRRSILALLALLALVMTFSLVGHLAFYYAGIDVLSTKQDTLSSLGSTVSGFALCGSAFIFAVGTALGGYLIGHGFARFFRYLKNRC